MHYYLTYVNNYGMVRFALICDLAKSILELCYARLKIMLHWEKLCYAPHYDKKYEICDILYILQLCYIENFCDTFVYNLCHYSSSGLTKKKILNIFKLYTQ